MLKLENFSHCQLGLHLTQLLQAISNWFFFSTQILFWIYCYIYQYNYFRHTNCWFDFYVICFSTFLSSAEEGGTGSLPQHSPTDAELTGSTAQETLVSWTQLMGGSISPSYFTPRRVWDGIKSCILQHCARQLFLKSGYFSNPANERGKQKFRMWARTVSLYTRCFC